MSGSRFVWVLRSWCSEDSFWEHVRGNKDFDLAFATAQQVLEEIQRITLKEQADWQDLHGTSETHKFVIETPTVDQIKNRPFLKFLTCASIKEESQFMQCWYVERVKIAEY